MGGISARRSSLTVPEQGPLEHPGLALARYLPERGDPEVVRQLLTRVADARASDAYQIAYRRWQQCGAQRKGARVFTAPLRTPMAIGLGSASVLEIGLTLHHSYGMPVIPGSALKGLCRRGAKRLLDAGKLSPEQIEVLFGKQDLAAYSTFWDAWFDPTSVQGKPFQRDVITVHHPDYYGSGKTWPTDFDDPNPVSYVVVKPGAQFLFTLDAPSAEWGEFAVRLLQWSLANLGVGAKTNSGYGYFRCGEPGEAGSSGAGSAGQTTGQGRSDLTVAIPRTTQVSIETFRNQTRNNLTMIIGQLEKLPPSPGRTKYAKLLVEKAEALHPPMRPNERELLERARALLA